MGRAALDSRPSSGHQRQDRGFAGPWERRQAQKSCRSQTFGGRQDCLFPSVPRCLSLAWKPGYWGAAGGRREARQLEGLLTQPAVPRCWGLSRPLPPVCGWLEGARAHSTKSVLLLAEATARQREPAISPHLEVRLLNLTAGLPGLGSFYARAPHLGLFHIRSNASQGSVCL